LGKNQAWVSRDELDEVVETFPAAGTLLPPPHPVNNRMPIAMRGS
jgi:hypothetical protein